MFNELEFSRDLAHDQHSTTPAGFQLISRGPEESRKESHQLK